MQYIKEDIENMLMKHKENEGKKIEIEIKLYEYQKRLDYAGTVYEDTAEEVIENMQVTGRTYDSTPSKTNKISDKVLNTALNYKKEIKHINKEDRAFLNQEIQRLNAERENIDIKIARVKNWLDKINEKEAFVLEQLYINNQGKNWNKVIKTYEQEYEKTITERQLRTTRDKAIQHILKIVNV